MTTLQLCTPSDLPEFDLLVVGMTATGQAAGSAVTVAAPGLADAKAQAIAAGLAEVGATGRVGELVRLPGSAVGLPRLVAVGLGPWPELAPTSQAVLRGSDLARELLRRVAGGALLGAKSARVAVWLPGIGTEPTAQDVGDAALGALLGSYRYAGPKPADPAVTPATVAVVVAPDLAADPEAAAALAAAQAIGDAVNLARQLVDTPPGDLPPAKLAEATLAALADRAVAVEVLDSEALAAQGYGGILAVGQGSDNPPRLIRMSYQPAEPTAHLALVGKGITFDSGGLSLKPPTGMITMKCDMAGAAAVLGAVRAIADLAVPVRVTAYLAAAENMPSGSAQRPGDVITSYGGADSSHTVEVLNTDAEGRLVMMDALVRAGEDNPDRLVDVATLTGAQVVALGARVAAVMGNDDPWRDQVVSAALAAGELAWPMPIPEELRASLESPVADLANIGEKNGGMMTAAAFLREFVPAGLPWAHLDIAGPAFNEGSPWGYNAKGGTGFAVRSLVALAQSLARGDGSDLQPGR